MLDGPDTPWERKVLFLAIAVDVIGIYKLHIWDLPEDSNKINILITVISGIILYFTIGSIWFTYSPNSIPDIYGNPDSLQPEYLAAAVCISPAILVLTIWHYIFYRRPLMKRIRKLRKQEKEKEKQ